MKLDAQLELQAYLDGELPPREARQVEAWLAEDQQARLLVAELQNTTAALSRHEHECKLPETREFYWHKIESEIRRLERPVTLSQPVSILKGWRRLLVPVGALAVMMIAAVFVAPQVGKFGGARFSETETVLADSGALTYRDYASGTTLLWLSYPPENLFAETDATDTIQ